MSFIFKEYGPYLIALIIGVLIGWQGCGDSQPTETVTIEKPEPKIEYVDRWKTDSVRFVIRESRTDTIRDTITNKVVDVRLDTLLKVDTLKIVEAWLTELNKYDTTLSFEYYTLRLKWQNYQNLSEKLSATLTPKKQMSGGLHIMMYAKGGMRSDFKSIYTPVIGGGLLFEKKRFIFGADYGYSGQHNINGVVGYRLR